MRMKEVLLERKLTPKQEARRDEIVAIMKADGDRLIKKYGANWETVIYNDATVYALEEDFAFQRRAALSYFISRLDTDYSKPFPADNEFGPLVGDLEGSE